VQIEQRGTEETNKGHTTHTWTEVRRVLTASPFYLRCQDGARVLVQPDERVALHDDLTDIHRDGPTTRTRRAVLEAGDRVHVIGELRGASSPGGRRAAVYRGTAEGPVLGPPPLGRVVISTEQPGDTEAKRAAFHRRWAVGLGIVSAFVSGLVAPRYTLLALDGKAVMAEVTGIQTWQQWVMPKNRPARLVTHHAVQAKLPRPDGTVLTLEDDCAEALLGHPYAPFVVAEHFPSVQQVGARPTLSLGRGLMLIITMLTVGFAYPASTLSSRPWYMKKKVNDTGEGSLAGSKP
jgi:hypothetical protein